MGMVRCGREACNMGMRRIQRMILVLICICNIDSS